MQPTFVAFLLAVAVAASPLLAGGMVPPPTGGVRGTSICEGDELTSGYGVPIEYYQRTMTSGFDFRCNQRSNGSSDCSLWGWLYVPLSKRPAKGYPTLIFNHGHNQDRTEWCEIAEYFTANGWAVFTPLRRGHRDSNGRLPDNTGVYSDVFVVAYPGLGDYLPPDFKFNDDYALAWYTEHQVAEVEDAARWLITATTSDGKIFANATKLALGGHSYGGAVTIFAAADTYVVPRPAAAFEISGWALDWVDNPLYQDLLEDAVELRRMPIFFLQPRDELNPARVGALAKRAATNAAQDFEAAFFPPVGGDDVHGDFVTQRKHVRRWGAAVLQFLRRYAP